MPIELARSLMRKRGAATDKANQRRPYPSSAYRICSNREQRFASNWRVGLHGHELVSRVQCKLYSVDMRNLHAPVNAVLLAAVLALCSPIGHAAPPQAAAKQEAAQATAPPATLRIEGAVPTLTLTAEDLAKLPRATATLTSDGGTCLRRRPSLRSPRQSRLAIRPRHDRQAHGQLHRRHRP